MSLLSCLRAAYRADKLLVETLVGVVSGLVFGVILAVAGAPTIALDVIGFLGQSVLLPLLKLFVLPLVVCSVVSGIANLSAGNNALRLAKVTVLYYLSTTLLAGLVGTVVVALIQPGTRAPLTGSSDMEIVQPPESTYDQPILDTLTRLFPSNFFVAAVEFNILGIIVFSCLFGSTLCLLADDTQLVAELVNQMNEMLLTTVTLIIERLSPIGIASLIAKQVAMTEGDKLQGVLSSLALYSATVLTGLLIHGAVVLPLLFWLFRRSSPWRHLRKISRVLVTAFGTDSSAAVLPLSMETAHGAGARKSLVEFVLPLGATINMNGTALYEATTALFIAQSHNEDLTVARTLQILLGSTFAAMGAAAVPSAGLVTLVLVLEASGLSQYQSDIGLVLMLDWFLDRCRTTVNVQGDMFGVAIIQAIVGSGIAATSPPEIEGHHPRSSSSNNLDEEGVEMQEHFTMAGCFDFAHLPKTYRDALVGEGVHSVRDVGLFSLSDLTALGVQPAHARDMMVAAALAATGLEGVHPAVQRVVGALPREDWGRVGRLGTDEWKRAGLSGVQARRLMRWMEKLTWE